MVETSKLLRVQLFVITDALLIVNLMKWYMCLSLWFSNWLSLGPRQGQGPRHGGMGCIVLCGTFHTAPEQGQGLTPIVPHCSGSGPSPCPSTGHSQCDYTVNVNDMVGLINVHQNVFSIYFYHSF